MKNWQNRQPEVVDDPDCAPKSARTTSRTGSHAYEYDSEITQSHTGTVLPTKSDSDVMFCLQLLSKIIP